MTSAAVQAAVDEAGALHIEPSLDEVRELARDHDLVPLRHTFIDDCETPVSAFLKLRGRGGGWDDIPAFLLESAEQGQRVGRYSFIGVRPREVVRWSLGDDGDPYAIAEQVKAYVRAATGSDLTDEELLYLIVHVERLASQVGAKADPGDGGGGIEEVLR